MDWIDRTLESPAENLALDELLLDLCEAGAAGPTLRFWEPASPFVVLGYGKDAEREVEMEFCRGRGIPVYRRCSGGGTVLQAPGVLDYALILPIAEAGTIRASNTYVMERQRKALESALRRPVSVEGFTDLCRDGLKFSGNAQRRKRRFLLFHGTFLLRADISLIEGALKMPAERPEYRGGRAHRDFLTNLGVDAEPIKAALRQEWGADRRAAETSWEALAGMARAHRDYARGEAP